MSGSAPSIDVKSVRRLHIGCGREALSGWLNVDLEPLPGVDMVHDVRAGLPFEGLEAIYAEHFLEHLSYDNGLRFLKDARAALAPSGVIRLSTPNLDWVIRVFYPFAGGASAEQNVGVAFELNKAFHGWGHQFLYNADTLRATLRAAGFTEIREAKYGQSELPVFAGIERHETYPDTPELPHVIIFEASGTGSPSAEPIHPAETGYRSAVSS